jgi:DNA polymerase III alpha subunit
VKFPLLNRTHYSLLRAFTKPDELVKACKASGFDSVGLCDFGSVSGAVEFLEACKKHQMRGIVGADFNGTRVFTKNLDGWKQLVKIVTEWNCDDCLNQVRLGSSNLIVADDPLNDCRYIKPSDEVSYRVLRALDLKVKLSEIEEDTGGFHLLTEDKILDNKIYTDLAEAEIFDITGPPRLPKFECPNGLNEIEYLQQKVDAGLLSILPSLSADEIAVYSDRVTYEMKVIKLADLAGYFLIVADFVAKAREDKQLASVGRGSAAGSLVSYLIGINLVNPIPYNLLFSRFFNAARAYPKHLSFDEYGFIDEFRDFESKLN